MSRFDCVKGFPGLPHNYDCMDWISTLSLQWLSPLLSPKRLQSGGRVRCLKASARLRSIFSHSCRGMWHLFSSSVHSVPSSWPSVLTRNWAMSKAKSWTKHICSEDRWWTRPSGPTEHRVTTTDSQQSWAGERENTERKMSYKLQVVVFSYKLKTCQIKLG